MDVAEGAEHSEEIRDRHCQRAKRSSIGDASDTFGAQTLRFAELAIRFAVHHQVRKVRTFVLTHRLVQQPTIVRRFPGTF